jgi:hypothetical protein
MPQTKGGVSSPPSGSRKLQPAEPLNIASGKLIALSSEDIESHPDPAVGSRAGISAYANDGRRGMDFFVDGCAQTKEGNAYPWIRIDFERPEHIGRVRIFARQDQLKAMKNIELRVGNIGMETYESRNKMNALVFPS